MNDRGAQVAGYQAGHRIRKWRAWEDHSTSLARQVREKSGPVTVRQATPEERQRFGLDKAIEPVRIHEIHYGAGSHVRQRVMIREFYSEFGRDVQVIRVEETPTGWKVTYRRKAA